MAFHAPQDAPLTVRVEDDQLVIRIGLAVLADAPRQHNDWRNDDDEPRLTVTDATVFANEIVAALQREEEDGTTPVHVMLDDAITYVVEQGGEGIELGEDSADDEDEEEDDDE